MKAIEVAKRTAAWTDSDVDLVKRTVERIEQVLCDARRELRVAEIRLNARRS